MLAFSFGCNSRVSEPRAVATGSFVIVMIYDLTVFHFSSGVHFLIAGCANHKWQVIRSLALEVLTRITKYVFARLKTAVLG
ncbi:MAG: hypothetical protein DMF74_06980 [Acidobacteria bacterium]|nr:MAG: hypothetical protein DMF74_06980 [Acidobacteriota bacterium]